MPTNIAEAKKIYDIVNDYVGLRSARELSKRLVTEIAEETDNKSLEESIRILYDLYHSNLGQEMQQSVVDRVRDLTSHHDD
tara:strand:- start:51 stop:293 length:243 start_codon:yes stop_codon:yes gene_type:complete